MDDVQQGKQTHSKGQFPVSEPLAKSCIEVSPTLKFCPPPNSVGGFCRESLGNLKRTLWHSGPGENRAAGLRWGQLLLVAGYWCALRTHPAEDKHHKAPPHDLRKSPWKQWNRSLHWNLESIPVSHRKKIRQRTTKPVVQRNLGRLYLTVKSWKTFFFPYSLVFPKAFSSVQPRSW